MDAAATALEALTFLDELDRELEEVSVEMINNTAAMAVRRVVNHASAELTIPSAFLRQHIRVIRRASETNKEALVRADQKRTNLARYRYSRTEQRGVRGITVERVAGRPDFIEGAFLIVNNGVPLIALSKERIRQRYPRVRIQGGSSQIQVLSGPTHNQIFSSRGREFGDDQMRIEINRYITRNQQ